MTSLDVNVAAEAVCGRGYLDEAFSKLEHDPEFIADGLALAIAEDIAEAMAAKGISKAELARTLGVSRSYVTRVLDAPPNLTLVSIAKVALALGLTPEVHLNVPRQLSGLKGEFAVFEIPMTKEARYDKSSPETAQLLSSAA